MNASTQDDGKAAKPYGWWAKAVHWGFTALFLFALTKQLDELEELEDFALLRFEMLFASLFLVLLIARFVFMRATQPTALPSDTAKLNKRLARVGHLAIYTSLALIALSGLAIGALFWSGTKTGLSMVVALGIHEVAVNASYFLIVGHIAAALYHRHQGTGIWNAMVPFWKEAEAEGD